MSSGFVLFHRLRVRAKAGGELLPHMIQNGAVPFGERRSFIGIAGLRPAPALERNQGQENLRVARGRLGGEIADCRLALGEFCDAIAFATRDLPVEFLGNECGRVLRPARPPFRIEPLAWLNTGMQGRAAIADLIITLPLLRARRAATGRLPGVTTALSRFAG